MKALYWLRSWWLSIGYFELAKALVAILLAYCMVTGTHGMVANAAAHLTGAIP